MDDWEAKFRLESILDSSHPLKPSDGTSPFYTSAWYDHDGYDSEDEFAHALPHPIEGWDLDCTQKVPPTIPCSEDRRFIWISCTQQPKPKGRSSHSPLEVQDADVVISLDPFHPEDVIRLPSKLLIESHPMFKAAFSHRWSRFTAITQGEEQTATMYELELDDDGESKLVRKSGPTSSEDRKTQWFGANDRHVEEHVETCRKMHAIAHGIGFQLLCGFPARFHHEASQDKDSDLDIAILLKVVEWVHAYGSFKAMAPQLERFILDRSFGKSTVSFYAFVFLRIAAFLKGKELFQLAFTQVVKNYLDMYDRCWSDPESNPAEWLAERLDHNYQLTHLVTTTSMKLMRTLQKVQDRLARLKSYCLPKAASKLVSMIWHDWYARHAKPQPYERIKTIEQIAAKGVSADALIKEHRTLYHGKRSTFPPPEVKAGDLRRVMGWLLEDAATITEDLLDQNGEFLGGMWQRRDANCSLDFEDFVYPWEVVVEDRSSVLRTCEEFPALGDIA